jgi:hypothetical protein
LGSAGTAAGSGIEGRAAGAEAGAAAAAAGTVVAGAAAVGLEGVGPPLAADWGRVEACWMRQGRSVQKGKRHHRARQVHTAAVQQPLTALRLGATRTGSGAGVASGSHSNRSLTSVGGRKHADVSVWWRGAVCSGMRAVPPIPSTCSFSGHSLDALRLLRGGGPRRRHDGQVDQVADVQGGEDALADLLALRGGDVAVVGGERLDGFG